MKWFNIDKIMIICYISKYEFNKNKQELTNMAWRTPPAENITATMDRAEASKLALAEEAAKHRGELAIEVASDPSPPAPVEVRVDHEPLPQPPTPEQAQKN